MLRFENEWVWDFWFADDGARHHVFYLWAPGSLGDEHRRHRHASVGHSSSTDLIRWKHHGTVLTGRGQRDGARPAFDASASWTGSVVRAPDGRWLMFYTGARFLADEPDDTNIQAVGVAVSDDLHTWKAEPDAVVTADPRWYETLGTSSWPEEAWRDPWVYADPGGVGWHMLVTARASADPGVADDDAGVLGHAWSPDLSHWQVRPPVTRPGVGYGHLEVPQVAEVDGRNFLIFSCPQAALSAERRRAGYHGGVWAAPLSAATGSFDVSTARLLLDERYYSGRVHDVAGRAQLLAVLNSDDVGRFVGALSDPMSLSVGDDGHLQLA